MRITIANVCGMGRVVKRKGSRRRDDGLHYNLMTTKPDICILTETKLLSKEARPEEYRHLRKWWNQHKDHVNIFQDCVTDNTKKRGVAILVKPGLNFKVNAVKYSIGGRHVIINISIMAHTYNIAAFYGYDRVSDYISLETLNFMYQELQDMNQAHPGEIIIAGDFNFTLNKDDSNTQAAKKPLTCERMKVILEELELEDAWLLIKGESEEKGHTYTSRSSHKTSRLDRIYIKEDSLASPNIEMHGPAHKKADHNMLTLDLRPVKTSKPLPKHPDYLLGSHQYKEGLCNTIREFLILQSEYATDYQEAPISLQHQELVNRLQEEQTLFREIDIDGTADLQKKFFDLSTDMIKSKLDNFFKQVSGEAQDPNPAELQTLMDRVVDSLDPTELPPDPSSQDTQGQKPSPISVLEALLNAIMQHSSKYRKLNKKSNPTEIIRLQQQHIDKMRMQGKTVDNTPEIAVAQEKINEESDKINLAHTSRSIITANLNEEKPTKNFLGRGKNNSVRTRITKIIKDGNIMIGPEAETHMVNLFKNLLGNSSTIEDSATVEDFIGEADEHTPKLSQEQANNIDREISIDELDDVVRKAHTDSSPGMSGVSYQLIKHIWPLIRRLFHKVTLQLMGSGDNPPLAKLPDTWCQRRIILIGKPNKPEDDDGSYRPISLLEITYKLVAGVMAERLKTAAQHLIGPSQKGYMPQRCAMDVTRSVVDTRNIALHLNLPLAIVGLDFSKAFDTVAHRGLFKILRYLKFTERFIARLQLLLSNAQITLDINGLRHDAFPLQDGTGQGDPISSYLFNIVVEIFLNRIIHQQNSIMFEAKGKKFLPEAYADDIHILAKGDRAEGITNIINTAQKFQELTGLALSTTKTEYLSILATDNTSFRAARLGLKLVDSIKFVGAHTAARPGEDEDKINFKNAFEKIERVERSWGWRRPSPLGAVTIIRSLMASTITHLLTNFTLTKEQAQRYDELTRTFVWAATHPQIRKARMSQPVERGGLNLVDIDIYTTALRTRWFRTLTRKANGEAITENWIHALNIWLEEYGLDATTIPDLGFRDLNRLGLKLKARDCHFWGENFTRYAGVVRAYEQKTANPMALPIFGGLLQRHATRGGISQTLSVFKKGLANAVLFKRVRIVGDLFHPHPTIPSRLDLNNTKIGTEVFPDGWGNLSRNELRNVRKDFGNLVEKVLSTIVTLPHVPRDVCQVIAVNEGCFSQSGHELQMLCIKHKKGSSFVYKEIIKAKAKKKNYEASPSFQTSLNDQNHNISKEQWMAAMRKLMKIHCSPRTRWQNLQIFLRTLWTPLKTYFQSDILDHALCPGCSDHWPANTAHLIYECSGLARNIWNCTQEILSEVKGKKFTISKFDALYFQHITSYTDLAVIAAAKRAILRVTNEVTASAPIHPKVAMACLRKEIVSTAQTNIKADRDTITWLSIERTTKWKWQQMVENRMYINPDPIS